MKATRCMHLAQNKVIINNAYDLIVEREPKRFLFFAVRCSFFWLNSIFLIPLN